jgi:hypothetical protein
LASTAVTPKRFPEVPDVWGVQVAPPFVVLMIVPDPPAAQAVSASTVAIPYKVYEAAGFSWGCQLTPPSVVLKITLLTTQAVLASTAPTLFRQSEVPDVWGVQVVPPFVVLRIVPESPTTHAVLASTVDTLLNNLEVPDV